ncbi:hypothetical protein J4864_11095 [Prevotella multiformis]|uniref:Lipoprotein n=1 Tax=Prevotella multiformis DSM 16608 TaxID=888743 RepID=F0FB21_9BACT|nr:hypothetical protein [Prevotella multiformis]EGC18784.1 hypothetical protein HMPREF9141_2788 [Prevotella multiformis DSM 16608]QUB71673.1 hypothetical protein J4864_11095 [Prevotella multiformis]
MRKKHLLYTVALLLAFSSCHRSLEDRAARECKEYTERKCPTPDVNNTRMDSMVFEPSSRTIHYYHTLLGVADNEKAVTSKKAELRRALGEALKADPGTKGYKDAGFSFRYTYHSEKAPSKVLFDVTYTAKDYQR